MVCARSRYCDAVDATTPAEDVGTLKRGKPSVLGRDAREASKSQR
jgi:hypothetical protein